MNYRSNNRRAFSLLELLAVVTIMGILAVVVIPRIGTSASFAEQNANSYNMAEINRAVERYHLETGALPVTIADINTATYFPDGIPKNPVSGANYALHATTKRAVASGGGGGGGK